MRTLVLALVIASASAAGARAQEAPPPDPAQPPPAASEEARALQAAGQASFYAERYDEALQQFRRAYELSHDATILFDVGRAAERAGADAVAIYAFERYLRDVSDLPEPRREYVEERIETLQASRGGTARVVPSPREAAARSLTAPRPGERDEGRESSGLATKWWVLLGAVAIAAVVGIVTIVLVTSDTLEEPLLGRDGFIVRALVSE